MFNDYKYSPQNLICNINIWDLVNKKFSLRAQIWFLGVSETRGRMLFAYPKPWILLLGISIANMYIISMCKTKIKDELFFNLYNIIQ